MSLLQEMEKHGLADCEFNRKLLNETHFIDNVRLDVIATYNGHEQEWFDCGITDQALTSESALIDYIREQLSFNDDLAKLSLCWYAEEDMIEKYQVIQESIDKNAKYYFN